ncbi:MAG: hypothetical protein LGR52_04410 [Candidatus Thiosymbion ectosymbiont of Robbea hypermnestra]|nr:hypothetical protein [Candidatus Thiosymbion ectosymbiont of Robbea hypermnestra]
MLTISSEQLNLLADDWLARRILVFLRQHLPEKCNEPDATLLESIRNYIKTARENGIRTERAIAKWSYLLLLTDGKLLDVNGVKDYLEQPHLSQSKKVDRLMKSLAVAGKLTTG